MGTDDVYKILEQKGKICARDLMYELDLSMQHAHRLITCVSKYDDVETTWEQKIYTNGVRKTVKYLNLKK